MVLSEQDIDNFFERIVEGFLMVDARGRILQVNRRLEEMFRVDRGELIGQPVEVLVPQAFRKRHEADRSAFSQRPAPRAMGSGLDLLGRRKDGSEFPIEVSLSPSSWNGQQVVYALVNDISRRKEAEHALEEERNFISVVLETVAALVVVLDASGRISRFNRACQETTGYAFADVLGRAAWDFLVAPEEVDRVRAAFDDICAGAFPMNYESHWITRNGERRLIAWSANAITDSDGRVKHVVGTGIDITERKRLEEQYLQAQKMEAIGRLAGGVAHDFNNVLSVISFDTEILMDALEDPVSRELLEEINRVIDRGASIVRELLTFSRPQAARPVIMDLNQTVRETTRMLQVMVGESVSLEVAPATEPATVRVDRSQIEQVLMNLTANARDAMPEGGRLRLEVAPVRLDDGEAHRIAVSPGDFIRLRVADTGTGIDPSIRERIFEPFFTTKNPGKGTGLGLSTTYGIVHRAGGVIRCDSAVSHGTVFEIYLPAATEPAVAADEAEPEEGPRGHGTILIVEDEQQLESSMRRVLEGHGYHVLTAHDGSEALGVSDRHSGKIDLLLTDVELPELRGPELARRLKEKRPDLRTVFVSGYVDDVTGEVALAQTGDVFLAKPFKRNALLEAIRKALETPESRKS